MRILGITDGQTSGAAIVEDGRILAAINEERIARIKLARGFPWQSIQEVMRLTHTQPGDIAGVSVATVNMEFSGRSSSAEDQRMAGLVRSSRERPQPA